VGRPRKNPLLIDELVQPPSDAEMEAELEYQDFITQLGDGNISVTIHRFPKFGNVLEWRENTTLDRSTLEAIKENHGPGKYKLTFRGPTGFMGAKMVSIGADYDTKPGKNGNSNGDSEKSFLHEQLVMQQNLMTALITGMRGPDMGALLAGMGAMMTALRPAEPGKGPDPIEMFRTIMTMYEGMKNKSEKSPIEALRETAAVIKEFSTDGGKGMESGWDVVAAVGNKAIDTLGPALGALTGVRVPAVVGAQPVRPPAAAIATGLNGTVVDPATAARPAESVSPEENLLRWAKTQIAFLKQKALADKDPIFWADYLFENEEEPGCQALMYAIRRGGTFENLLVLDPEIGQNPELAAWFREAFNRVQLGLSGALDTAGNGGDPTDPVRDGTSSTPGQPGAVYPGISPVVPQSNLH